MAESCSCRGHLRTLYLVQAMTLGLLLSLGLYVYVSDRSESPPAEHYEYAQSVAKEEKKNKRQASYWGPQNEVFLQETKGDRKWLLLPGYVKFETTQLLSFCRETIKFCDKRNRYELPTGTLAERQSVINEPLSTSSVDFTTTNGDKPTDSGQFERGRTRVEHARRRRRRHRISKYVTKIGPRKKKCYLSSLNGTSFLEAGSLRSVYGWWQRSKNGSFFLMEQFNREPFHLLRRFDSTVDLIDGYFVVKENVRGTNHLFHNHSFWFHKERTDRLYRYDTNKDELRPAAGRLLKDAVFEGTVGLPTADCVQRGNFHFFGSSPNYLYDVAGNSSKSFVDLSEDETGLWAVYRHRTSGRLRISKLESNNLGEIASFTLRSAKNVRPANSFVICGVLYTVESAGYGGRLQVAAAYDLFRPSRRANLSGVPWPKELGSVSAVSYNKRDRLLYVYDNGRLATVRVDLDEPNS